MVKPPRRKVRIGANLPVPAPPPPPLTKKPVKHKDDPRRTNPLTAAMQSMVEYADREAADRRRARDQQDAADWNILTNPNNHDRVAACSQCNGTGCIMREIQSGNGRYWPAPCTDANCDAGTLQRAAKWAQRQCREQWEETGNRDDFPRPRR